MKLVTGLLEPSNGLIMVGGKPVRGAIQGVGMAFQNSSLLPWRSTLDNVMLPLEIVEPHKRRLRKERKAYVEQAMALLKTVGFDDFAEKFPWQLPGRSEEHTSDLQSQM